MKKRLHIISEYFPYGSGEQFIDNEVKAMSNKIDEIVIYPLHFEDGKLRYLPDNVSVNLCLAKAKFSVSKIDFITYFRIIFSVLLVELRKSKSKKYILKKMKVLAGSVVNAAKLGQNFEGAKQEGFQNFYYSFWMNNGALLLAILKNKGKISDFNFRVNGYDLFAERRAGQYMPFRYFNIKMVKNIFAVSTSAVAYLRSLNFLPQKNHLAYNGISDHGFSPAENGENYTVVSCSNLIPLKRVDKIIEALKNINLAINWFHFGGGPLQAELELKAETLPKNINYQFMGNRPNSEIIDFFKERSISAFVHTSESEGLGMSIIEAQSFGIPAVAIGVGGVVDIVTNRTGVLLKEKCSNQEITDAIVLVLETMSGNLVLRKQIKEFTLNKFAADKVYDDLYHKIVS